MKKLILLLTLLVTIPVTISAQAIALDSTEVSLILRDNENAHVVAGAALGALSCVLESLSGNAEWTPQECVDRLEEIIEPYSQEHTVLHPMVVHMLKEKLENLER